LDEDELKIALFPAPESDTAKGDDSAVEPEHHRPYLVVRGGAVATGKLNRRVAGARPSACSG